MSICLRPHGDGLAKFYGEYFSPEHLATLIQKFKRYEVLCDDGKHYMVKIKEFDNDTLTGVVHFLKWRKKYDYSGSLKLLYITNLGTYSEGLNMQKNAYIDGKSKHEKHLLSQNAEKKSSYMDQTRYDDSFLAKPRLFKGSSRRKSIEDGIETTSAHQDMGTINCSPIDSNNGSITPSYWNEKGSDSEDDENHATTRKRKADELESDNIVSPKRNTFVCGEELLDAGHSSFQKDSCTDCHETFSSSPKKSEMEDNVALCDKKATDAEDDLQTVSLSDNHPPSCQTTDAVLTVPIRSDGHNAETMDQSDGFESILENAKLTSAVISSVKILPSSSSHQQEYNLSYSADNAGLITELKPPNWMRRHLRELLMLRTQLDTTILELLKCCGTSSDLKLNDRKE